MELSETISGRQELDTGTQRPEKNNYGPGILFIDIFILNIENSTVRPIEDFTEPSVYWVLGNPQY